jgi:DNA-binding beta-propeller fold protein YncE
MWTEEQLRREPWVERHVVTVTLVLFASAAFAVVLFVAAAAFGLRDSLAVQTSPPFGPDWSVPPSQFGLNAAISASGKTLFVTDPASSTMDVIDVETGVTVALVHTGPTPVGLTVSPNGRQVWVVNSYLDPPSGTPSSAGHDEATVVSATNYSVLGTVRGPGFASIAVAFSPDGRLAYITNQLGASTGGVVEVFDTDSLRMIGELEPAADQSADWYPASVAVTPDGKEIWVSSASVNNPESPGFLYVFSSATDGELSRIKVGEGSFT